jgi:hypothetical protein
MFKSALLKSTHVRVSSTQLYSCKSKLYLALPMFESALLPLPMFKSALPTSLHVRVSTVHV